HSTPLSSLTVRLLLVIGLLSPRLQFVVKQVDGQRQGLLQLVVRAMIIGKLEEIVDDHLPGLPLGVLDLALDVRLVEFNHRITPLVVSDGGIARPGATSGETGTETAHCFPARAAAVRATHPALHEHDIIRIVQGLKLPPLTLNFPYLTATTK